MQTSETVTKIAPALLVAQQNMESAKKDSKNPYFKSSYADYNSVLEACKQSLNDNGIIILQPHVTDTNSSNGEVTHYVETVLMHSSGEYFSSRTKIEVAKLKDPQALGSAITYARRYGLQSLVALPAADDDGEKTMSRSNNTKTTKTSAPERQAFRRTKKETVDESTAGDALDL